MSGPAYLFDANVWIGLAFAAHPHHARATRAFREATPTRPACFCRSTQQSVLRLLTTPAILDAYGVPGLTNNDALATMARFMASPSVAYREEPPEIAATWHSLAALPTASPKVWMDAYLAAFAILGGLVLVTFDQAFTRYAGLNYTLLTATSP